MWKRKQNTFIWRGEPRLSSSKGNFDLGFALHLGDQFGNEEKQELSEGTTASMLVNRQLLSLNSSSGEHEKVTNREAFVSTGFINALAFI